jgi:hypothetical protein
LVSQKQFVASNSGSSGDLTNENATGRSAASGMKSNTTDFRFIPWRPATACAYSLDRVMVADAGVECTTLWAKSLSRALPDWRKIKTPNATT